VALDYNWVDPKELNAFQIIEPGEGKFKILKAEERVSRAGNNMMVITFRLTDSKGASTLTNEYIIASTDETQSKRAANKIYSLLTAIDKLSLYGKPLEARHIVGDTGRCIIKTQKSEDPQYPDKSVIAKYISMVHNNPEPVDADDDIPF
jgi:hypothetical protein